MLALLLSVALAAPSKPADKPVPPADASPVDPWQATGPTFSLIPQWATIRRARRVA